MLCIYGCFLKNGGCPQSPPQVLIIFSRKTHGPVGETHPFYRKSPAIWPIQRLGQCHKLTTLRLDFFTLASMQPAYTPYVCLAKLSHGKMPAGRYLGRWAPKLTHPPEFEFGNEPKHKLLVKLHILDWYLRKGGFVGGIFLTSHFWGFQRGTGGTGG